jgi:hypothetical protein
VYFLILGIFKGFLMLRDLGQFFMDFNQTLPIQGQTKIPVSDWRQSFTFANVLVLVA